MDESGRQRFSALYARDFRLFFIAQLFSLTGTWMQSTAQGWLVYSLTGSAFYLGVVGVATSAPLLLFTFVGGLMADKFSKRNILLMTQGLSIVPVLVLAVLTSRKMVSIEGIIVIAFLLGTVTAIDVPVRQSFLVDIAGKRSLLNAIALNSTAFHAARVVGPLVAAFVIRWFDLAICFYINALSYIPVLFVLYYIKPASVPLQIPSRGIWRDMAYGFVFFNNNRQLGFILLTITMFSLLAFPLNQFLPVFADKMFSSGVQGLGYLLASLGSGSLLAGLMIAFRGEIQGKITSLYYAGYFFVISLMIFPLSKELWQAVPVLIIMGWSMVSFLATANSYVQMHASDEMRGRVMAVFSTMFLGMLPIGYALMGSLSGLIGLKAMVFYCACLCLAGFTFFSKKWKQ